MYRFLTIVAACLFLGLPGPALASDAIFPVGGTVGLEPPGAMIKADAFAGFQDKAEGASILIVEFPAEAYAEMAAIFDSEKLAAVVTIDGPVKPLKLTGDIDALLAAGSQTQQGVDYRKWVMIAQGAEATAMVTVQIPSTSEVYTDQQVLDALQSVRFQPRGSLEEQIAGLPFTLTDRSDFRAVRTLAGSGLLMTDGPKDVVTDASQPLVIIASSLGSSPMVGILDEDQRMKLALNALQGLEYKDFRAETTDVEEDGDVVITGKGADPQGREMNVHQIMRFGPSSHVRTVCVFTDEQDIAERCDRVGQAVVLKGDGENPTPEE